MYKDSDYFYSDEPMLKALRLHRSGESIRNAAKMYDIAYPTLRRYAAENLHDNVEELAEKKMP